MLVTHFIKKVLCTKLQLLVRNLPLKYLKGQRNVALKSRIKWVLWLHYELQDNIIFQIKQTQSFYHACNSFYKESIVHQITTQVESTQKHCLASCCNDGDEVLHVCIMRYITWGRAELRNRLKLHPYSNLILQVGDQKIDI